MYLYVLLKNPLKIVYRVYTSVTLNQFNILWHCFNCIRAILPCMYTLAFYLILKCMAVVKLFVVFITVGAILLNYYGVF